eukprot:TRINITY_DN4579_c0_g1_i1.p1 TRINITY_DN4579_c0_g1~~TRINITY_DN4579_c0_g1_i1.p1  ORF type:complete len:456 (-),score=135.12 TRINITY_DN4579_c0_g1_i1:167-1534(-)
MKSLLVIFLLVNVFLTVTEGGHGHAHDHHGHAHGGEDEPNPAFKWSKAANTAEEDPTLDEEGIDYDNIETIVGHGHAHVVDSHDDHDHHGHAHDHHGHSHGPPKREPTAEEREKFRKKLHANWDDDDEEVHSSDTATVWFNAIMATLLISAAPFFILFFIPLDNSAEKQWLLKILLAFASGGLLGDAFLHLIPHALMAADSGKEGGHGHSHGGDGGEHAPHDMSVGLGVLSGIVAFLCVEKFVRIMKGGHGHSHEMPAKPVEKAEKKVEKKKAKSSDDEDTSKDDEKKEEKELAEKKSESPVEEEGEIKVAGFLNLAADCFHNFTDGLAIGASFLAGESIGIITTLTILLHEVPHEIGDFAILIQSGVPRNKAIALQALTAVGALTGCVVSLLLGGATEAAASLTLPFTAGGFIYIATVSVIPELLEGATFKQSVMEVMALLMGVGMMVIIAQYE